MTLAQFPVFGFFFQDSQIGVKVSLIVLPVDIIFQNLLKVTDQTKNWVDALESKICSECGYDFTDTTLVKSRIGF